MTPILHAVLIRLERWLEANRQHYWRVLQPGASPSELDALQKHISIPLPGELRTLLAWHNGQSSDFIGGLVANWRLMSTQQIAEQARALRDDAGSVWQWSWIPFLHDDAGNYLCLDATEVSIPVRAYWAGNSEHKVVAASLTQWMTDFVEAVERGEYVEEPERGTFMRRR